MIKESQIKKLVKLKQVGKHPVGYNLYLRISPQLRTTWLVRYMVKGRTSRKEKTIGPYPAVSLADALQKAGDVKFSAAQGIDFFEQEQRNKSNVSLVDELFQLWLAFKKKNIETWHLQEGRYRRDIKKHIGHLRVADVAPIQIRDIIECVSESGRPSVANDVLLDLKGIFGYGQKLQIVTYNPAEHFTFDDAGGVEESRKRKLSLKELDTTLDCLRQSSKMTRDSYLSFALLLVLAVRKMELLAATWDEFDFENSIWTPDRTRLKGKVKLPPEKVPLEPEVVEWLTELKYRGAGSRWVFPNRRKRLNARFEHVSPDTLNTAIDKMFQAGEFKGLVEHFTVHDLRRTARTLMSENGITPWVAESCLGHRLKGVEGVYNLDQFFGERRKAQRVLLELVAPLVNKGEFQ